MENNLKSKIRDWWNGYPFTYFVKDKEGSWEFFRNIDRKILKWMPWAQEGYPLLSKVIDYKLLKGKKILDIACGTGWSSEQFARAGADVTAIDITPKAVELAKKRFELYSLRAEILVADAENLSFPDNSFDYILAWGCLMHMPNTQKAISEIYRVLKPGGWFFFKTFLLDEDRHAERLLRENSGDEEGTYLHPKSGTPEHVFTEEEIMKIFEPYFTIHKISKSHRHILRGRPFKRRSISVYAEKKS